MNRIVKQIKYNTTARTQGIRYIVIHDTGNSDKGADAENHYKYFNGGNRNASADFFVDDHEIWQVNDYNKNYSWHCGSYNDSGITNKNSVGIEICINADGNYDKAVSNTIELVKELMRELSVPWECVVRHYDASGKICPQTMSTNNWAAWKEFKERLKGGSSMTEDWAKEAIEWAVENKILYGDENGDYQLDKPCTRREMVAFLHRLYQLVK